MAVTLHWVVYASAGSTPSAAQVVAGQDATGSAALASGSEAYTAGGTYDEATAITSLSPGTTYKVAWAGTDGLGNYTNVAESAAITMVAVLAIADATHAHAAEGPTLSTDSTLAVADAAHAHAADSPALTVQTAIAVDDAAHAHAAEAPTLTTATDLAASDALHAHAADAIALSAGTDLSASDALHAHSADSVALTSATDLAAADAAHGHAADSITLGASGSETLAPADALHAHSADSLVLTTLVDLSVADASHAHLADGLVLTTATLLAIQEAVHAHSAEDLIIVPSGGSTGTAEIWGYVFSNGLTAEETAVAILECCQTGRMARVEKLLRNKQITNPVTGKLTLFDDDDVTPLLEGDLFEDADGTQPYRGQGAERRERLT